MKNFEKDQDFLDLLAAWHENKNLTPVRRRSLLARLTNDSELRQELAREIEMAGLTRAAQAGEHRWLELEEILQSDISQNSSGFEHSIMEKLKSSPQKSSKKVISFPQFSWIGLAASFIFLFFHFSNEQQDKQGVAEIIRLEGKKNSGNIKRILAKGEEFTFEQGLVEMAFRESGVHLVGTGPLQMTLVGNDRVFLKKGEIKLVVPPQGIGFVVDTMERKFVDLGTSFVVQANTQGSKVLVLDGEIAVGARNSRPSQLMRKGSMADFDRGSKMKMRSGKPSGVPEISLPIMLATPSSLQGQIIGFQESSPNLQKSNENSEHGIAGQFLPLIQSKFQNQSCLQELTFGRPLRFAGIAGTYNRYPNAASLSPYDSERGWLMWYDGKLQAPQPGRYRFWGYADNHLLVAVNGKPVFEGSRYDSSFRNKLNIFRNNHPSFPCLNARAGFARGEWFEVRGEPVDIDLLFGESSKNQTSGILLIEQEGIDYENTYWGQPKWPLFLTELPEEKQLVELDELRIHMEENIQGSFSISADSIWTVTQGT
ncbi:MAG: hypothetical protein P8N49_01185 [Opitutales bacterium]|nr:hypothetical protein [Opitutales bacterium]